MPDLWAYDNTIYDDDDVYQDFCAPLHKLPASVPMVNVDLYINQNAPATQSQGSTKSHYTPVPGGAMLFDSGDKSDYQFSVERLAWVDGWQETTEVEGKLVHKQPMTLVVLKFSLQTFDRDLRVETVKATLQFKDADQQRGDDPEVQAWAPFHDFEDWNTTESQNKSTANVNATASGGYGGASLSLAWGKGSEISWNRTAFDEGRSILVKSRRKQRPIGVTWSLKQNRLQNMGVSPVFWAAVLVKRSTNSPYLAKFRLDVRTGTVRDAKSRGLELLRIKPGDTSSFTATPNPCVWDKKNCFGEGENIRDSGRIDLLNLGKLLATDRTSFVGTWGPRYQRSAPILKEADGSEDAGTAGPKPEPTLAATGSSYTAEVSETQIAPGAEAEGDEKVDGPLVPEATGIIKQQQGPQSARPGSVSDLPGPPRVVVGADIPFYPASEADAAGSAGTCMWSRLVDLEARAARTDARLAAHDQVIVRLLRVVDEKDARLARMEQALRVAAAALALR
ncbi:hypothetical protein MKX07_003739 [Trichoderma sp. CBMAI-0711]|nr:hypothetical protein MKX07_003739 [Trichoderma sp. CBMAI-0711]